MSDGLRLANTPKRQIQRACERALRRSRGSPIVSDLTTEILLILDKAAAPDGAAPFEVETIQRFLVLDQKLRATVRVLIDQLGQFPDEH
jgi:hypothetical protein